jgi:hypothetical protein
LCSHSSPPRRATQVSLDASGAVSGAKSYPRLLQADCVVRGDDLDADMDVLRKSDASCEVRRGAAPSAPSAASMVACWYDGTMV